ncbi:MAG: hypothetical protein RL676_258 [Pseudomonadota bacterium]
MSGHARYIKEMNIQDLFSVRCFAPLPSMEGFAVSGPDTNTFLQGQLTNDVVGLKAGASQRTGYCTPKGRLLATMLQWRIDHETVGHVLPREIAASTVKRLRMYVLRAKAAFSAPESAFTAVGLWGDWTDAGMAGLGPDGPNGGVIALGQAWLIAEAASPTLGSRAWLVGPPADVEQITATLSGAKPLHESAWWYSEIENAKPWVWSATVEAFVPQMINFELVDGVSFTKGCYPGQEVVARSQYLGKLKRRMFRTDLDALPPTVSDAVALIGQDIWSDAQPAEPCGQVVAAAPRINAQGNPSEGVALLVQLSLAAWETQGLHIGALDGPLLAARELPYAIPAEASA